MRKTRGAGEQPSHTGRTVAVLLPYVNGYRAPFLEALRQHLASSGVELMVFTGRQVGREAGVGDRVYSDAYIQLPQVTLRLRRRVLSLRLPSRSLIAADLVVLEQATRNLESYLIILLRSLARRPVAQWGHGYTITETQSRFQCGVQSWMMKRSSYFFAYTDGSAARGRAIGARPDRTTVLNNSIDTRSLARMTLEKARTMDDAREWRALYIGALHSSKRLGALLDTARRIHARNPRFVLTIAGSGADSAWLRENLDDWMSYVGHVDDSTKAELASTSRALLVPGRVGLIAVDSFAMQLPIATVESEFHAPEFEYLDEGNSLIAQSDDDLVEEVLKLMDDPVRERILKDGCRESLGRFDLSVEAMSARFATGAIAAMNSGDRT